MEYSITAEELQEILDLVANGSITHGHILTEWPGLAEVKGIHT